MFSVSKSSALGLFAIYKRILIYGEVVVIVGTDNYIFLCHFPEKRQRNAKYFFLKINQFSVSVVSKTSWHWIKVMLNQG